MMHSQVFLLKSSDDGTVGILEEGRTEWISEGIDERNGQDRWNQKYECTALSGMDSYNSQS